MTKEPLTLGQTVYAFVLGLAIYDLASAIATGIVYYLSLPYL